MSDRLPLSVGYPIRPGLSFYNAVAPYLSAIGEIYFSYPGLASGRAEAPTEGEICSIEGELSRFRARGIRTNLLLNANCYGAEAISQELAARITGVIDGLCERVGLSAVTTASPFVAELIKRHYPAIDVRASVNMWLDGVGAMAQCADLFDSFYIRRDYHYSLDEIKREREWCLENNKRLYLLANSGCIPYCAFHTFHDNMIAHAEGLAHSPQDRSFEPYACRRILKEPENRYMVLSGNLVRPEDIHHYRSLVDGIKLATRIHPYPAIIIGAYARVRWQGDVSELSEPGFADLLAPYKLDNAAIPPEYWERKTACRRAAMRGDPSACRECGFCAALYEQIRYIPMGDRPL